MTAPLAKLARKNMQGNLRQKQFVVGCNIDGSPFIVNMYDVWRSIMWAGASGAGKTTALAWLGCMAVLANARLAILDPHGESPEGVLSKIKPLEPWFVQEPLCFMMEDDLPKAVRFFRWLDAEITRRIALKDAIWNEPPILCLIEEYNVFLDMIKGNKKEYELVVKVLKKFGWAGRKAAVYAILAVQDVMVAQTGSGVRDALPNACSMRLPRAQMRKVLGINDGTEEAKELEGLLSIAPFGNFQGILRLDQLYRIHFPSDGIDYADVSFCSTIADMVHYIGERREIHHLSPEKPPRMADTQSGETSLGDVRANEEREIESDKERGETVGEEVERRVEREIEAEERVKKVGIEGEMGGRDEKEWVKESESEVKDGEREEEEGSEGRYRGGRREKRESEIVGFCKNKGIAREKYEQIVAEGKRVEAEGNGVRRTEIRDRLREKYGASWNNKTYWMITEVCKWWGWDRSMGKLSEAEKRKKKEQAGYKCQECGRSREELGKNEWLELDHIKPKSLGGSDGPMNRRVLCSRCNKAKAARWFKRGA